MYHWMIRSVYVMDEIQDNICCVWCGPILQNHAQVQPDVHSFIKEEQSN